MNIQAANRLLKTLEEPTEQTVIILVSEKPEGLLTHHSFEGSAFSC